MCCMIGAESRSWARSLAAWFARGIRHLLEHLYPPQDGAADGNNTEVVSQEGHPYDKDPEDSVTKPPRRNVFRPWTALPPPYPPGKPIQYEKFANEPMRTEKVTPRANENREGIPKDKSDFSCVFASSFLLLVLSVWIKI